MIILVAFLATQAAVLGPPEILERSFIMRTAWEKCVAQEASKYAPTGESADLIVQASFGRCRKFEAEFRTAFQMLTIDGKHGFQPEYVGKALDQARAEIRETAIAAFLDAKLHAKARK